MLVSEDTPTEDSYSTISKAKSKFPGSKLHKITKSNRLYFEKRCRSRSYCNIDELNQSKETDEGSKVDENSFGTSFLGKKYYFEPKDYSITQKYQDLNVMFEDTLSPSVITLTKVIETGKVSKMFRILDYGILVNFKIHKRTSLPYSVSFHQLSMIWRLIFVYILFIKT